MSRLPASGNTLCPEPPRRISTPLRGFDRVLKSTLGLVLGAVVLVAVVASAASLTVNAGTLQTFFVTPDISVDTADGNIKITPSSLNADSNGEPVKAHLKVPLLDECLAAGVSLASAQLRIEGGAD